MATLEFDSWLTAVRHYRKQGQRDPIAAVSHKLDAGEIALVRPSARTQPMQQEQS